MHIRMKIIIAMVGLSALIVIAPCAMRKQLPSDEALRAGFLAQA